MNSADHVKRRIRSIVALSGVPEDPLHSENTLEWLLRLKGDADDALQIAALGHDIERAIRDRKVRRDDFADYREFKAAHARNSAEILKEIMLECGVEDRGLVERVYALVCRHETGGDPDSDLLKDADAISYFDVNLAFYYDRNGWEETRRRALWGYRRLSEEAKKAAAALTFPRAELHNLVETVIEENRRKQVQ